MKRRTLRLVLFVLFFGGAISLVNGLIRALIFLAAKSESVELMHWLQSDSLLKAILVGLVAGLIPVQNLFVAFGGMQPRLMLFIKKLNPERLKPWAVVFVSPLFVLSCSVWALGWLRISSQQTTVFGGMYRPPFHDLVESFFSTGCFSDARWSWSFWGGNEGCVMHSVCIHISAIATGYSLAPFLKKHATAALRDPREQSDMADMDASTSESTMTETTDIR